MVKNHSQEVMKQHHLSTFIPSSNQNGKQTHNNRISQQIAEKRLTEKTVNSTFKVQNINSLSSSTKSNKSALSTLSSITNSSSYRSNDGAIVVIEIGENDVGIDVGTIDDHLISTSPSSSPLSLSSSSSPNSSNSISYKNASSEKHTEKLETENDSYNLTSHESIEFDSTGSMHEERGIDCPEYFIPEFKQKPCYPPSLLQVKQQQPEEVSILDSVVPKRGNKSESKKSSKSRESQGKLSSSKRKASQSNLLNNADFEAEIVSIQNIIF